MKLTKKLITLFTVAAVLLTALVPACAVPSNSANSALNAKKILVVYYSASGTTERLAKVIAKELGANASSSFRREKRCHGFRFPFP